MTHVMTDCIVCGGAAGDGRRCFCGDDVKGGAGATLVTWERVAWGLGFAGVFCLGTVALVVAAIAADQAWTQHKGAKH